MMSKPFRQDVVEKPELPFHVLEDHDNGEPPVLIAKVWSKEDAMMFIAGLEARQDRVTHPAIYNIRVVDNAKASPVLLEACKAARALLRLGKIDNVDPDKVYAEMLDEKLDEAIKVVE